MIEIKNLHKYFNRFKKNQLHVINDVSLKLPNKGLIALLGPSGSGKTTMLNMIGGLDTQTKGKILINGKKLSKRSSLRRDYVRTLNVGYIFQDYKLIDEDSVFDNVALSLRLMGIKNKKEIKRRVEFILDKVGMFRYRYRPAGMLSGGERQRVGIARALVKDPDIILADEPTGNLDSKNTLDVMNIITQISKDKLVVLVTHEQNLAKFYADRVIEFADGVIKNDYKNDHPDELDYQIENKFYLKDFKYKNNINVKNAEVNIYSNDKDNIKIDIVVKNGNYYIKTYNNFLTQVVDEDSSLEFVDEHYKKINKDELEKVSFDAENIKHKRYSSIFNVFTFFSKGFQKVFNYSLLKKLLLGGFLLSGGFILYAVSSYVATVTIKDEQFIKTSRDYTYIKTDKNKVSTIKELESIDLEAFVIPGDVTVKFQVNFDSLLQFNNSYVELNGSITPNDNLKDDDIIYGRLPMNNNEIVLDKLLISNEISNKKEFKMAGLINPDDFIDLNLTIRGMDDFVVVGISDKVEPCMYVNKDMIIPIILGNANDSYDESGNVLSYSLNKDNLRLVKGRVPTNDYETLVNYDQRYEMPLYKKIDKKVNNTKLLVVGYYVPIDYEDGFITNDNTVKYNYINKSKNAYVFNGKINKYKDNGFASYNTYDMAKKAYKSLAKDSVKSKLIVSAIIISISLIEVFLISRSSFLSKIKEVGTYRAIGVKKMDICKMFMGEAFAITTLASVPGIIFTSMLLKKIIGIKYFKYMFIIDFKVVFISIIIVYIFNIFVSLLPVINLMRKTPANILSRNDVD